MRKFGENVAESDASSSEARKNNINYNGKKTSLSDTNRCEENIQLIYINSGKAKENLLTHTKQICTNYIRHIQIK